MIGNPEAQRDFIGNNQTFVERITNLKTAMDAAVFNVRMETLADKVIYYLTRMVFEDLNEVVTLCANGLSTGGMKILRGMFERSVTVCYLRKFPEKVDMFWNFFPVNRHKQTVAIEETFPGVLPREGVDSAKAEYLAVKDDYVITDCKKCSTKRVNFFWQKDHVLTMAKQAGGFEGQVYFGYYRPMEETHPSAAAIARRARMIGDDSFEYDDGPRPEEDRYTLLTAHYLLLKALEALKEHFHLEAMEGPMQVCLNDMKEVWALNIRDPDAM